MADVARPQVRAQRHRWSGLPPRAAELFDETEARSEVSVSLVETMGLSALQSAVDKHFARIVLYSPRFDRLDESTADPLAARG